MVRSGDTVLSVYSTGTCVFVPVCVFLSPVCVCQKGSEREHPVAASDVHYLGRQWRHSAIWGRAATLEVSPASCAAAALAEGRQRLHRNSHFSAVCRTGLTAHITRSRSRFVWARERERSPGRHRRAAAAKRRECAEFTVKYLHSILH